MRHLRASINNEMWCMQESLLVFQRTSRNRNAPLAPPLRNHADTQFRGGRNTKPSARSTEWRIHLTRVHFPFPSFIVLSALPQRQGDTAFPRVQFLFLEIIFNLVSL